MTLIQNKNLIGFAAYSGTGKTTLIKEIVEILKKSNYRVSVIKHAHHNFDIDHPGKDSYEIRKSGAENMLISSQKRYALVHENDHNEELRLIDLIKVFDNLKHDIILVEGFKAESFPKIELYRKEVSNNRGLLSQEDQNIIAVATENGTKLNIDLPILDINKPQDIANFIVNFLNISR